jgi:hypothetical protein
MQERPQWELERLGMPQFLLRELQRVEMQELHQRELQKVEMP